MDAAPEGTSRIDPDAPRPATVPNGSGSGSGSGSNALRAVLERGAICPNCRYDLAGLSRAEALPTACPECGTGLEAGLVGTTGPRRFRQLMVLMFCWIAFAGTMNATRLGVRVHEFYLSPQWARVNPGGLAGVGGGFGGGWSAVPTRLWLEFGGWAALGLVGIAGGLLVAFGTASPRRERHLLMLLVLGFVAYWGYHGVVFVSEMLARL
ncbi:MAG: hypothetical protein R3B68_03375 [Phycisphaerales bacterium]